MVKAKSTQATEKKVKVKMSRPGVHSKTKSSKLKSSKFYQKKNRGQGK